MKPFSFPAAIPVILRRPSLAILCAVVAAGAQAVWANVPPLPPFPEEFRGKTAIVLAACCSGMIERGRELLSPLENLGNPILKSVQPMPYKALQQSFDDGTPHGNRYYWKAHYLDNLSDEAIDTMVSFTGQVPGELSLAGHYIQRRDHVAAILQALDRFLAAE